MDAPTVRLDGGLAVIEYGQRHAIFDPGDADSLRAASAQVHLAPATLESLGRQALDAEA